MKHAIITTILLIITGIVTVFYFKNISQASQNPADVLKHVPTNALLVTEFSNDEGFYEAFDGSELFTSVLGPAKTSEFRILTKYLLQDATIKPFFKNQPLYISLHPGPGNDIDFLITTAPTSTLKTDLFQTVHNLPPRVFKNYAIQQRDTKIVKLSIAGLERPFYITENGDHVFSASFSLPILETTAQFGLKSHKEFYLVVPAQQHNNALTILYVNYEQLKVFLDQIFISRDAELLRPFRLLAAQSALSLNYKKDALMFNGATQIDHSKPVSYLNLFTAQLPVENNLKDIYPSTTAYSITFSVSNAQKFVKDLSEWHGRSNVLKEERTFFKQIKKETGVNIDHDVNQQLGSEFGVVTTRFQERLAIIELKNGQQLYPSLMNISTMRDDGIGQFNYEKIAFYLLGDAFSIFRKPYFEVINNFLILANTPGELKAYTDSYNNQKFLSKTTAYNNFDVLQSERSNVSFFLNFKNAAYVFKRDMKPAFYKAYNESPSGLKNFYGISYQLSASDNNYYTNLCLKLNDADTTKTDNNR